MYLLPCLLLAAGESASQAADKAADQNSGIEWQALLAAAVAAISVAVALWAIRRRRMARAQEMTNSPTLLLQELCARHGLSRPDQRLLAGLARDQRLENPALLFVDPRLWELSRMGSLGHRYAAQLGRLRAQIFEM